MNAQKYKRRLTAILSADVAGYSRLMGDDEVATVGTITVYRDIMADLIEQHRGRLVDAPGDNVLAEFASVVDAAQCAVAVQKEIQSRNTDLPAERRMQFRMGINLGDVIEENGRIYGDGVNIAARLEALADPGGVCISKTAFDHIESKLPLGYIYIGQQYVKNITKPVIAYKVIMDPRVTQAKDIEKKHLMPQWSKKSAMGAAIALLIIIIALGVWSFYLGGRLTTPARGGAASIVVLPFSNLSDDPEQEAFSDGITDELIGALAKVEELNVTSQTSAFSYKDKDVNLRTVGKQLGVDHVLEGSVRKSGNMLRVSAQLISVADDTHLWSQTYDHKMDNIFDIQDEISRDVVKNIKKELLSIEDERQTYDYIRRFGVDTIVAKGETLENGLSAFGANIEIAGTVYGGLEAFGANILVSGRNQGDLKFIGGNVILAGEFLEIVDGMAANVTISGVFEDDLTVTAGKITIAPTAVIKGDFAYATALLERNEGSQIMGKVVRLNSEDGKTWEQIKRHHGNGPDPLARSILFALFTIAFIVAGLLANFFFPKPTGKIVATLSGSPWKSLGIGFIFIIGAPLCIILLIFSAIGIPVGIFVIFLFITMLYMSRVYVGLWIGKNVLGYLSKSMAVGFFFPLITGTILIGALSQVPTIGWFFKIFSLLIGLGAMGSVLWTSIKPKKSVKNE